jgi:hypothetical protein
MVSPDVVTRVVSALDGHFAKTTSTRGHEHVFLGMNIVYTEQQTAEIAMKEYL